MKVKHVIVLHGLYMSGFVMRPLCSRLEESGVKVLNLTYNTLDPNRDAIFAQIDEFIAGEPSALVCHSMGGLVARAYLEANSVASQHITKVVTLGTPHQGSHIAQKMKQKGFESFFKKIALNFCLHKMVTGRLKRSFLVLQVTYPLV
ncbi:cob(I)alamin adenosyltransferase [Pseudoalteromonas sp. BSi20495]|nr:cob(I)alamin adenosyltransferase [Pseudoalteromonas sp. BSi20495]